MKPPMPTVPEQQEAKERETGTGAGAGAAEYITMSVSPEHPRTALGEGRVSNQLAQQNVQVSDSE